MFVTKKAKQAAAAERESVKGEFTAMKAALSTANEKVVGVIDRLKKRVGSTPKLKVVRSQ